MARRARWRRVAWPLAAGAGAAAALGYVWAVDPQEPGHFPLCPTRWLLGVDCPGCGLLRGTHSLLHGDVAEALDHNVLLAVLVPLGLVLWAAWLARAWRGTPSTWSRGRARWESAGLVAAIAFLVAFGVVRNFVPYLGSGLG